MGAVPAQPASPTHQALGLAAEAAAASGAQDHSAAVAKLEQAVALRPDMPRLLEALSISQVAADRLDDAIATLERSAKLGAGAMIDKTDEFVPLRPRKDFQAVVKKLAANLHPKGSGEIAFTLRDVTGLIEGIAWREKTGAFYFGDVHGRAVWLRPKDGTLRRFTPADSDLLGVFALVVDEATGTLWAATNAVSAMRGYSPEQDGSAALVEIDLETGEIRQTIPPASRSGPAPVLLGDLALLSDGTLLVTDSKGPLLWRHRAGGKTVEPFIENSEFLSLQGIVPLSADVVLVSDQFNGLLRVDVARRTVQRIVAPADTTLIGLDGLALAAEGSVLAVQNGMRPIRIVQIAVDDGFETVSRITVLESGHLAMSAPSLGCIATGGDFHFVGNPGWNRFEHSDGKPTAPRPIPVFRTKLGGANK